MEGGKQAVGGAQQRPTIISDNNNNNGGHNDAVDFFYKSRGLHPLFTQMEVYILKQTVPATLFFYSIFYYLYIVYSALY